MPAYLLLIAYYITLTILVIVNIFVIRQLVKHMFLGAGIKAFTIAYATFWGVNIIVTHIYILISNWSLILL